jgi:hypothetical protein
MALASIASKQDGYKPRTVLITDQRHRRTPPMIVN